MFANDVSQQKLIICHKIAFFCQPTWNTVKHVWNLWINQQESTQLENWQMAIVQIWQNGVILDKDKKKFIKYYKENELLITFKITVAASQMQIGKNSLVTESCHDTPSIQDQNVMKIIKVFQMAKKFTGKSCQLIKWLRPGKKKQCCNILCTAIMLISYIVCWQSWCGTKSQQWPEITESLSSSAWSSCGLSCNVLNACSFCARW